MKLTNSQVRLGALPCSGHYSGHFTATSAQLTCRLLGDIINSLITRLINLQRFCCYCMALLLGSIAWVYCLGLLLGSIAWVYCLGLLLGSIGGLVGAGELNSLQRKSDSQGRDLKKVMRDNAAALSEFEKALVRKSEECNVSKQATIRQLIHTCISIYHDTCAIHPIHAEHAYHIMHSFLPYVPYIFLSYIFTAHNIYNIQICQWSNIAHAFHKHSCCWNVSSCPLPHLTLPCFTLPCLAWIGPLLPAARAAAGRR